MTGASNGTLAIRHASHARPSGLRSTSMRACRRATTTADAAAWTAPTLGNTLDSAMLYHFESTANVAPAAAPVMRVGAATSAEAELPYMLVPLGPAAPRHSVSAH